MPSKALALKKLFIRRMIISAVIQFVVLAVIFILVKHYVAHSDRNHLINNLTINDSFSKQELARYKILSNDYAFNLALHNIANDNKLDSIWFTKTFSKKSQQFGKCSPVKHTDYVLCHNKKGIYYGFTPLKVGAKVLGYVIASKKYSFITTPTYYGLSIILLMVVGVFLFNFIVLFFSMKGRIEGNTQKLLNFISDQDDQMKEELNIEEYSLVAQQFSNKKSEIAQLEKEKSYNEAMKHLATQVAHDIRSPLTAINSLMNHTTQLPEDQRTIVRQAVQRINDIANNLLAQYKNPEAISQNQVLDSGPASSQLIYPILDSLISEKRSVIPHGVALNFNVEQTQAYLSCSPINKVAFSRVISNLLNNAMEAIDDTGEVSLIFKHEAKRNLVIIEDTGKGIPESQQAQLFNKGFSLDKENGSGFGLYYAKKTIESWGGDIELSSQQGQGTRVTVQLPASQPPQWLAQRLLLIPTSPIIILDDDNSIHDVWRSRLKDHQQLIHFCQIDAFKQWWDQQDSKQCLLLIDYEFVNNDQSGLDIIHECELGAQATLVTSHFEEPTIIENCLKEYCTLLPKNLASYVPIEYLEEQPDCVYIDDDSSIRDAWDMEAAIAGKHLYCFANAIEFERFMPWIPYTTPIYIDSNLGYQMRGEDLAKEYYEQGYQTIYLVTGYQQEDFAEYFWLKGVLNKNISPF